LDVYYRPVVYEAWRDQPRIDKVLQPLAAIRVDVIIIG